jgi:hypothetical protein
MSAHNMAAPRSSRSSRFAALSIGAAALATLAFYSGQQHDTFLPSTFAVASHGMLPISARCIAGRNDGVISDRSDSLVACHAKRVKSKKIKLNQGKEYAKRHKMELLTKKELRMRTTKLRLLRRADIMETERWLHENPNSPTHQWSVVQTRQYMEANQVDTDERIREQLGIPLPPIRFMRDALNQIRQERLQAGSTARNAAKAKEDKEGDGPKKVVKARAKSIDLTDINSEFMSYRGIAISKKKAQQTAQRKKR